MDSKHLDKIKSSISLSLGLKNRMRDLKGSRSYEEYIQYLLRFAHVETEAKKALRDHPHLLSKDNLLTQALFTQEFHRVRNLITFEHYSIIFSYNKFVDNSMLFEFDIHFEEFRIRGKKVSKEQFFGVLLEKRTSFRYKTKSPDNMVLYFEYKYYFAILEKIIQLEIEPLFEHSGRFENSSEWKIEFQNLVIGERSFKEDVLNKLRDFERGGELNA